MTSTSTCPRCGQAGSGRFCTSCGAALGGVHCTACGAASQPGDRFCNACGAALGGSGVESPQGRTVDHAAPAGARGATPLAARLRGTPPNAGWWVAAVLMVGLILAVAVPAVRNGTRPPPPPPPAADAGGAGPATGGDMPDLASMTPRQAADRLYERIMQAASVGDSSQVAQFLPMGMAAYERARPLDADGIFHLALFQRMAGEPETALATAEEALDAHPNHLLNLSVAAGAAAEAGDTALAESYYQQLLSGWEDEMARDLAEYEAHRNMMPEIRAEAEAFLDRG